jgi:ribosomal protein S7
MRSLSTDRRTAAVILAVAAKILDRQEVKEQIEVLQAIIDNISNHTSVSTLKGYVRTVTGVVRRIAKVLT